MQLHLKKWLSAVLVCTFALTAQAQDESKEKSPDAKSEIAALIKDGDLDAAAKALDSAVESVDAADQVSLQRMRSQIGMAFLRKGNNDQAITQYRSATDYFMDHLDTPAGRTGLQGSIITLHSLYSRNKKSAEAFELVGNAIEKLRAQEADDESDRTTSMITMLLGVQARTTGITDEQRQTVLDAIIAQLKNAETKLSASPDDEPTILAVSSALSTAANAFRDQPEKSDEFYTKREELIAQAFKGNPKSTVLANSFGSTMGQKVGRIYRNDPDAAQAIIDESVEILEKANEDSKLDRSIASLKRFETQIESAMKVKNLVGQVAPDFEIDAWINNADEASVESLKGKVVMLDFWAVWCGPCIATFPHLREWREEFKDQGFEIVGVTRYYNYRWDESSKSAERVNIKDETIEAEVEQSAVEKFMAKHDLKHPCFVTPGDSTMQSNYGVTGIPHAVLIDRQGKIRMIKVGSGEKNAKALHAMIEELLTEDGNK